jgi:hypothetical protein
MRQLAGCDERLTSDLVTNAYREEGADAQGV